MGRPPHIIDIAKPTPGAGSTAATLHLPPPPLPPQELPPLPLLQPPQLLPLPLEQPPPLQLLPLPLEPPLHELPHPLEPPLPLDPPLQLPPDELELPPPQPPPPPPPPLDVHALQLPPQPLWSLELEQALSQDNELLQLGPEQSQLGEALQLVFWLLLHELPQLTEVDRGGSLEVVPPSSPGNWPPGVP
jgi:hypothetical protein